MIKCCLALVLPFLCLVAIPPAQAMNGYVVHKCNDTYGYSIMPYCAGTIQNRQLMQVNAAGTAIQVIAFLNSSSCTNHTGTPLGDYGPQCSSWSGERLEIRLGDPPIPPTPVASPVDAPIEPPVDAPIDTPVAQPVKTPMRSSNAVLLFPFYSLIVGSLSFI